MSKNHAIFSGRRYVIAQDPPAGQPPVEDLPPLGEVGGQNNDPVDEAEQNNPEEIIQEIVDSPAAKWQEYLQPIIQDLKVRFDGQPISLLSPEKISETGDYDLGFYIVGYIRFLESTPSSVLEEFGSDPLHFKVFVDGEGKLHREHIEVFTELD
jgi:hypothetical protein